MIKLYSMEILEWIKDWFASHCDGDWEHENGINIQIPRFEIQRFFLQKKSIILLNLSLLKS